MSNFEIKKATRQGVKNARGPKPFVKPQVAGPRNPRWVGGQIVTTDGRVMIYSPFHPWPSKGRYVYRYRLKLEQKLKRFLLQTEIVHHKIGTPGDDRLSNLEILTAKQHNTISANSLKLSGKWSRKHDRCLKCKTTHSGHAGNGLCTKCHDKARWPKRSKQK